MLFLTSRITLPQKFRKGYFPCLGKKKKGIGNVVFDRYKQVTNMHPTISCRDPPSQRHVRLSNAWFDSIIPDHRIAPSHIPRHNLIYHLNSSRKTVSLPAPPYRSTYPPTHRLPFVVDCSGSSKTTISMYTTVSYSWTTRSGWKRVFVALAHGRRDAGMEDHL